MIQDARKNHKVFMLMHGIRAETGGMTRVMLNRSKMLSEMGYSVELVTMDEADYIGITRQLRKMGRLAPGVNIINIHDYYRELNTLRRVNFTLWRYRRAARLEEPGFRITRQESKQEIIARYFKKDRLVKVKRWENNGKLSYIEYYNEAGQRVRRDVYNRQGFIAEKHYFDPKFDSEYKVEYCTADSYVYLTRWYSPSQKKLSGITLYSRKPREERLFRDNADFHIYWLNELCRRQESKPFIICDGIGSAPKVIAMDPEVCYRIYPTHSTHLNYPYTYGSPLKKSYEPIMANLENADALVVPTMSQYHDVVRQFGNHGNVFVIPHSVTPMQEIQVDRDPKTVVMVARLNPEKAIDEAILAFKKVTQFVPDAKLEIYGEGPCRNDLQRLIQDLGLEGHVKLMRYLTQVEKAFRKASMMLLTSKFEGFPMVILEAMWNETPVISYDINYGPRDVIRNGENGFLVEAGNQDQLAKRMIQLLEDPSLARKLGIQARKDVIANYSEEVVGERWVQLFQSLASGHRVANSQSQEFKQVSGN
jgi:glycosyltransferase involved in cell wall biosynthesis